MKQFFITIIYLLAIFRTASVQNPIQGKVLNTENTPVSQAISTLKIRLSTS